MRFNDNIVALGNTVINTFNDGTISNTTFGIVNNRTNAFSIYDSTYVPLLNMLANGDLVLDQAHLLKNYKLMEILN